MIETVGVGQSETEVADVADTVAVVVQPGSGDVLQFLKSGIMEIPDVLVVTKADLGQVAVARARRPRGGAALAGLRVGGRVGVLGGAARGHRRAGRRRSTPTAPGWTSPTRRVRSRRMHALADYAAEYGDRGLRALGGRREAERWLAQQDGGLDVAALRHALEEQSAAAMTTTPTPRIVLPGDPLVEGDTALRPWRDADLPAARGGLPRPRDRALDERARPPTARPTPATTCASATTPPSPG